MNNRKIANKALQRTFDRAAPLLPQSAATVKFR